MEVAAVARACGLPVVAAAHKMMQLDVQLMATIPNSRMFEHIS
jgi:hypothetical protein